MIREVSILSRIACFFLFLMGDVDNDEKARPRT